MVVTLLTSSRLEDVLCDHGTSPNAIDARSRHCPIRRLAHVLQHLGAVRGDGCGSVRPVGVYAVLPSGQTVFVGYWSDGPSRISRMAILSRRADVMIINRSAPAAAIGSRERTLWTRAKRGMMSTVV